MTYKFKVKAGNQIDIPRICRENSDKDGFVIQTGEYCIFAFRPGLNLNLGGGRRIGGSPSAWPSFLPNGQIISNNKLGDNVPPEVLGFTFLWVTPEDQEIVTEFFKALAEIRRFNQARSLQVKVITS